ncbi:hypothetical protein B0H13DRAFT_1927255 [Mycena leptocephala]|nr:hypothetical protein B0H13DRAFT_1927255 [Mycena leptocephala]
MRGTSGSDKIATDKVVLVSVPEVLTELVNPTMVNASVRLGEQTASRINSLGQSWEIDDRQLGLVAELLWGRAVESNIAAGSITPVKVSKTFPYAFDDGNPALLSVVPSQLLTQEHGERLNRVCERCGQKADNMRAHMGTHILCKLRGVQEELLKPVVKKTSATVESNCRLQMPLKYAYAERGSRATRCRNVPIVCGLCPSTLTAGKESRSQPAQWRYNMEEHLSTAHPEYASPRNPRGVKRLPHAVWTSMEMAEGEEEALGIPLMIFGRTAAAGAILIRLPYEIRLDKSMSGPQLQIGVGVIWWVLRSESLAEMPSASQAVCLMIPAPFARVAGPDEGVDGLQQVGVPRVPVRVAPAPPRARATKKQKLNSGAAVASGSGSNCCIIIVLTLVPRLLEVKEKQKRRERKGNELANGHGGRSFRPAHLLLQFYPWMRAPERPKASTARSFRRFKDPGALGLSRAAVHCATDYAMIPQSSRLKSLEDKYRALHHLWSTHCSSLDKELGQSARETRIPREVQDNSAAIPNMECLTLPCPTLPDDQGVNQDLDLWADRGTELIEDAPAYYASRLQWSRKEIGCFWNAFAGAKKDFSRIAIPMGKPASECIEFYYLNKRHRPLGLAVPSDSNLPEGGGTTQSIVLSHAKSADDPISNNRAASIDVDGSVWFRSSNGYSPPSIRWSKHDQGQF